MRACTYSPELSETKLAQGKGNGGSAGRYELLDMMRALAAVWVMLYHYHWRTIGEGHDGSWYEKILGHGYWGVAIFFVLSGYCIMASANKARGERRGVLHFIIRRMLRIMPPFWLSLVLIGVIPGLLYGLDWMTGNGAGMNYGIWQKFANMGTVTWVKQLTLTSGIGSGNYMTFQAFPLNEVCWSLAIELQFYVITGIALLFGRKYKWVMAGVFVIGLLSVVPSAWLERGLGCMRSADWLIEGTFLPYWSMFFMGVITFEMVRRGVYLKQMRAAYAADKQGVILLSSAAVMTYGAALWVTRVNTNVAIAFMTSMLLWGAYGVRLNLGRMNVVKAAMRHVLLFLGKASYAIYIVHMVVINLAIQLAMLLYPEKGIEQFVLSSLLGLMMCVGFYYLCERPFAKMASGWNRKKEASSTQKETVASIGKIDDAIERIAA
ncbi:Acyltransferase family protein [Poriferisphaera corsica]|uniref:Acyltransferase family protein n=1 Tax=Poriferisphaera corsica TaxID=2528020 RepID=A0A517YQF9_9BACT|nr:acyltransferase [Poriferisphaera corsica]QDU32463.1 Acyltransferase family protein [Poriferisphaera corsica]